MQVIFGILLTSTAAFLILLVLIQRGQGGGLAGAFGGMGGQSAFGTKAGDLFTRITIGVAIFWILLCIASVKLLEQEPKIDRNIGSDAKRSTAGSGASPAGASTTGASTNGGAAADGRDKSAKAAAGK